VLMTATLSKLCGVSLAMVGVAALACGGDDAGTGPDSAPVAALIVKPPMVWVAPGATLQLHAFADEGAGTSLTGDEVTWSSGDEGVARVSQGGLVRGISDGTTVVTASTDRASGSATVTVRPVRTSVESIELVPETAQLGVSETLELLAIARDKDGNVVSEPRLTWGSTDNQVATVSQTGLVTGIAAGTAMIMATTQGEKGTALITVASRSRPPEPLR